MSAFQSLRLRGIFLAIGALLVGAGSSGCASLFLSPTAKVSASARPGVPLGTPLPEISISDSKLVWVPSEIARITAPDALKFSAAREAFWNYDTTSAVKLLRELRQADDIEAEHFHALVFQCYRLDDRWADTLPLYGEFGLEEQHGRKFA